MKVYDGGQYWILSKKNAYPFTNICQTNETKQVLLVSLVTPIELLVVYLINLMYMYAFTIWYPYLNMVSSFVKKK